MKKLYKILLFIALITFFSSCYKVIFLDNIFSKERKLTLIGFPNNMTNLKIGVYMSDLPQNVDSSDIYIDPQVYLYQDGELVDTLTYDTTSQELGISPYFSSKIIPQIGKTYRIVASYEDKSASVNFSLPQPVKIAALKVERTTDTAQVYKISVTFQDPDTVNNYAIFAYIWAKYWDYFFNFQTDEYDSTLVYGRMLLYLNSEDENTENNENIFNYSRPLSATIFLDDLFDEKIISDVDFNGKTVTKVYTVSLPYNIEAWDGNINVGLVTLSNQAYKYFSSLQLYERTNYNPFVEPVNVYINVENGLGAVVTMSIDTAAVRVN